MKRERFTFCGYIYPQYVARHYKLQGLQFGPDHIHFRNSIFVIRNLYEICVSIGGKFINFSFRIIRNKYIRIALQICITALCITFILCNSRLIIIY